MNSTRLTDRETTAQRLLKSSAKTNFDPEVDIDWDAPLADDLPYLPWERSSLYGTSLWDGLTTQQRIELTKHEFASLASTGVWFEMLLMQMLLKDIYDQDPTDGHVHYALTEIGDECRHSTMFTKAISRVGAPAYGPPPVLHLGGKVLVATASGPSMYAAMLVAEEILDGLQRDQMNDESIQPLVRMINRIHVTEEARHVTFAREEVVRRMQHCNAAQRAYHQYRTALIAYSIVVSLINPRVYKSIGVRPRDAHRIAWNNPNFQQTIHRYGERIVSFLDDVGLIGKPGMHLWRRVHLIT
jgi:hypothetical protein